MGGAHGRGTLVVQIDANATLGTLQRQGSGRLNHVDTNELWLQERAAKGEFTVDKIPRGGNVEPKGAKAAIKCLTGKR